ncbi:hypothetical protein FA09DRAFT_39911 [Tilletiopsis washingtonensis]|uniref:Response regulatory domain-containing protein n=1 Tax=Tilletiopsis washingtonensis TaxID=58919 RepID=A0A316Z722_9BASI|nr:hypothetical protein FA09DRAFT_39911 [Tilletiopsis washingtonensis]PWN97577.1 hypothetical protein FA09DRAFT_39911 [Tilletiopsis washingtonensis]
MATLLCSGLHVDIALPTCYMTSKLIAPSMPATPAPHKLRILLVDDNSLNLKLLSRLLTRKFAHRLDGVPICVDDGLKAIQALSQDVFDVIFLDIQMPFVSGIDVAQRIRAGEDGILPANQSVKIYATTTAVGPAPELLYRSVGMDGLLPKPVQLKHLGELLAPLDSGVDFAHVRRGDGSFVRPPIASPIDALFYMTPSMDATIGQPPSIVHSGHFADDLREQTRASLRRSGVGAARCASISGGECMSRRGAAAEPLARNLEQTDVTLPGDGSHRRGNSVTISSRILTAQIAREVARLEESDRDMQLLSPTTSTRSSLASVCDADEVTSNSSVTDRAVDAPSPAASALPIALPARLDRAFTREISPALTYRPISPVSPRSPPSWLPSALAGDAKLSLAPARPILSRSDSSSRVLSFFHGLMEAEAAGESPTSSNDSSSASSRPSLALSSALLSSPSFGKSFGFGHDRWPSRRTSHTASNSSAPSSPLLTPVEEGPTVPRTAHSAKPSPEFLSPRDDTCARLARSTLA